MCKYCERRTDVKLGWDQPELPWHHNQDITRNISGNMIHTDDTVGVIHANVLHVSLDYLSGLSEIPNSHNNKVIPLEKALEYCDKQRQMWHEYSLKALKNNNRMDSVGAVALGDRNEVMYGYEIPNILRLLCKDKEIL